MKLGEYLGAVPNGSLVVVEYSSLSPVHVLVKAFLRAFEGRNFLIVDVFDTFFPVKRSLELAGEDVAFLENTDVVKGSGGIQWGRVLRTFDVKLDPNVYLWEFTHMLQNYYSKNPNTVSLFFGIERIMSVQPDKPAFLLHLTNVMNAFIGDGRRVAVYFINRDVSDGRFLGLVEDVATHVLSAGEAYVEVLKSPKMEDRHLKLEF